MMNDALLCCFNIETLCMWYLSFAINFFLDVAKLEIKLFIYNTQK